MHSSLNRLLSSFFLPLLMILSLFAHPAFAQEKNENLEEAAITEIFTSLEKKSGIPEAALTTLLDAVVGKEITFAPKARFGKSLGALQKYDFAVPLQDIIRYIVDPSIPSETLFPRVVRTNYWLQSSAVKKASAVLLKSPLPPKKALVMRGQEFEETTPDASSGCYYSYLLNRAMVLMPYKGGTALASLALMPKESYIGKRGLIVGDDTNANYVYSLEEGTNLPMLSWAKTKIYSSATISLYVQDPNTPNNTTLYMFKWTSAGWNKMNVVENKHILGGMQRFYDSMKAFFESPKRPSPEALATEMQRLGTLPEKELFAAMQPYVDFLKAEQSKHSLLRDKLFAKLLEGEAYPASFTHAALLSDLIKQYTQKALVGEPTTEEKTEEPKKEEKKEKTSVSKEEPKAEKPQPKETQPEKRQAEESKEKDDKKADKEEKN